MSDISNTGIAVTSRENPAIVFNIKTLLPTFSALLALLVHLLMPNSPRYTQKPLPYFTIALIITIGITLGLALLSLFNEKVREKYAYKSWFITTVIALLNILNFVTLKLMLLPAIYFPNPDRILKVFMEEWQFILKCLAYSGRLLGLGYILGATIGITTGILVGWSKGWSYWVNPLIKILGPIPSTAWVPIALVSFANSFQASVFLIALAVWFPTTVLTSSGISNVKNAYFEVSSTLGASTLQKIFKIALPDAMPSIFIGIFNGTCSSFITLMTAEMLGVKFGIGWYINWQREMLSYANVYAGLMVIAFTFSFIITLMFKVRDRVLGWQKGVIKW
ncbi:bicarbonate transport system permease protein CmpB [Oxobacter pfennigii]|uniref:Bicarbonate transport system permease protein CmpB n=1 Tax=Oxobacter pfennigii TaxID=36849 RepID=A0A0P8WBW6_9CLOT|nr:ABC transporter permease subunit [Oxobacter pfennigii]KPU46182.1 bicarbonate transport system permease protein CmpB [Oxobacter pfennigii]